MTALQELIGDLRRRGISLEPVTGGLLAIDPIEKVRPDELKLVREYKPAILRLLAPARQHRERCWGDDCSEVLTVVDNVGYCHTCNIAVIFVEGKQ